MATRFRVAERRPTNSELWWADARYAILSHPTSSLLTAQGFH